jgi:hypothetical protein
VNKNLRDTIDRMVEDAIRRVLPGIMNEVLLKTIANSGVIQERAPVQQQRNARLEPLPPQPQRRQASRRPASLNQLLDPEVGADFYADPRAAMQEAMRVEERPAPRQSMVAQMIKSLPPELQGLAEDVNLDDDGGEMWEDDEHGAGAVISEAGPSLDRAAAAAGLDFSVMKRLSNLSEAKKAKPDASANQQFEELRIKRMRERLNGGKPVE